MNISDNINVVLSELGRNNVPKAVLLLEDSLAVLNKRNKTIQNCGQVRTSMEKSFIYVFNKEKRSAFVTSSVDLVDSMELVLFESSKNSFSDISTKLSFILNLEITMVVLDMATAQSSIKNKPFALSLNALIT
jgi:hypothetical protein